MVLRIQVDRRKKVWIRNLTVTSQLGACRVNSERCDRWQFLIRRFPKLLWPIPLLVLWADAPNMSCGSDSQTSQKLRFLLVPAKKNRFQTVVYRDRFCCVIKCRVCQWSKHLGQSCGIKTRGKSARYPAAEQTNLHGHQDDNFKSLCSFHFRLFQKSVFALK